MKNLMDCLSYMFVKSQALYSYLASTDSYMLLEDKETEEVYERKIKLTRNRLNGPRVNNHYHKWA